MPCACESVGRGRAVALRVMRVLGLMDGVVAAADPFRTERGRLGDGGDWLDVVGFAQLAGADTTQLWRRAVFGAIVGNLDDHLRNHGLLRRGVHWKLAPAFDVNPEPLGEGNSRQRCRQAATTGRSTRRRRPLRIALFDSGCRANFGQAGSMTNLTDSLMLGPRGRRMCLEYVAGTDEGVRSALFWLGHELDPNPGVLLRTGDDAPDHEKHPAYTGDAVAELIDGVDLAAIRKNILRASLQRSVDLARYWQEPDGEDAVAALPAVQRALRRIAERVVPAIPGLTAPREPAQWAVEWHPIHGAGALESAPAVVLAEWARGTRDEEARATRERPADPHANWSGTWWSVPQRLLSTRGSVLDALELVEDSLGWEAATVIPVRGSGKTLEIQSPDDWADLCREYPMEVTASRRHDWFRVTGRHGRWLIPDWQRVSERWDAVHLTTLGYLSAATRLIEVDAEYASVIGGWGPDSTIWLTDVAQEADGGREQWTRPSNDWRWTRTALLG